eukprot:SM000176S03144  [mRNA]  locus=s176:243275:249137:+ [translate_table: standard]
MAAAAGVTPRAAGASLRHGGGAGYGAFHGPPDSGAHPAQAAEAGAKSALQELEQDDIFSKFLVADFNATTFASQVLSTGSALASSKKLSEGIALLERQLRVEVVMRHDELLQQLSSLKDTESVLAIVRAGIDSLQASVQRVRSEIADPYRLIKLKSIQLASLHETVELLRIVIRFLKQVRRLRDQMSIGGAKGDLAKAAQLYNDVESLRREVDLDRVEVVQLELPWLVEVGQQIRAEAMRTLEAGMEALSQAEVGSVLQVYYNMGELKTTVEALLAKYRVQATRAVATALDMKAISASAGTGIGGPGGVQRSGTPQLGSAPRAREALWQRLQVCMDQVHSIMMAAWHLQRVLAKKRDPITHVIFLDEVVQPGEVMPTERVWEALARTLTSQLKAAFTASSFAKETFVGGFPKLLGLMEDLLERLARDTDVKGVPAAIRPEGRSQLAVALEPFQAAYLGQSLTKMVDQVNSVFPANTRGSLPTHEAILRLVTRAQEELEVVNSDVGLTLAVLRGVSKALQLLAERSEYQVATGPDARQVAGPATPSQQRNFALCLLLQDTHQRITSLLAALPVEGEDVLSPSLGAIYGVASESVEPIFMAMRERIESSLLQMHDQDFGGSNIGDSSSPYMEDTVQTLAHFKLEFFSKLTMAQQSQQTFPAPSANAGESIIAVLTQRLAARVLQFFVRHAALVRPLSEAGKLRMARDMADFEFHVGQSLYPLERLGAPFRALRAFRPLIFLETSLLASSPLLQELPPSVVLHHLFSRAPDELESPLQRNRLSPAKYSLWLDSHSEEDTWKGIRAGLESYAQAVRARGDREFTPIYPLMLSLGQSLIESRSASAAATAGGG